MVRRRVEIKRIEDNNKRQVTFTKRRQGLFKKAGELCKKCDAEIAVMTISAAGNFYAFGNPTFESVIERYKAIKTQKSDSPEINPVLNSLGWRNESPDDEKEDEAKVEKDIGLDLCLAPLNEEKKPRMTQEDDAEKGLVLENDQDEEKDRKVENMPLWDLPVDELKWDELQQLIARIEEMKKKVVNRVNDIQGQ